MNERLHLFQKRELLPDLNTDGEMEHREMNSRARKLTLSEIQVLIRLHLKEINKSLIK